MTRIVLDSSFALAWCFEDEASPRTDAVLNQADQLIFAVSPLWRWEIVNVLLMSERRGRIKPEQTAEILARLALMNIELDEGWESAPQQDLLRLSRQHKLTAYDATYLEMALRLKLQIATLDGPLETAAKNMGVTAL